MKYKAGDLKRQREEDEDTKNEVAQDVLKHAHCTICYDVPQCCELRQCSKGHLVCSECATQTSDATPNGLERCPTCRDPVQHPMAMALTANALFDWVKQRCEHCKQVVSYRKWIQNHGPHCKSNNTRMKMRMFANGRVEYYNGVKGAEYKQKELNVDGSVSQFKQVRNRNDRYQAVLQSRKLPDGSTEGFKYDETLYTKEPYLATKCFPATNSHPHEIIAHYPATRYKAPEVFSYDYLKMVNRIPSYFTADGVRLWLCSPLRPAHERHDYVISSVEGQDQCFGPDTLSAANRPRYDTLTLRRITHEAACFATSEQEYGMLSHDKVIYCTDREEAYRGTLRRLYNDSPDGSHDNKFQPIGRSLERDPDLDDNPDGNKPAFFATHVQATYNCNDLHNHAYDPFDDCVERRQESSPATWWTAQP